MPENTLAAYGLALELGVDAIELDVHLARDGELAVMHDARLERTTDGSGAIGDYTLAELKTLDAAAKHPSREFGVQRIPTLQEVYDFIQGKVQINLEIKTDAAGKRYDGIEQKVIDLLRRNRAEAYTVLSSFNFPTLTAVQALAPNVRAHAIVSKEYFAQKGSTDPALLAADVHALGLAWVAVNKAFVTPALVQTLQSQGITVHGWVINEPAEMWAMADMGVDRITTDRPDILLPAYRQGRAPAAPE